MTEEMMALRGLLEKSADADLLREKCLDPRGLSQPIEEPGTSPRPMRSGTR